MGDVGVLAALSGRDNWQVVREERQRELQLAAVQNHMAKQEFQDQQEANAKMQDYLQTVGKIKVLDPAIPGIEKLNDQLTNMVREGVLAAGGDVKKYLDNGGLIELNKYKEGLLNSPEVAKGVMSAANYNRLNADKQLGLVPRGDAEGELQKYMKGETDAFGYQGAYKMPDLKEAREYFGKTYGKNPYRSQAVDPFSFAQYAESEAIKQNLSPQDAADVAQKAGGIYQNMVKKGGQPYMFGTKEWKAPSGWGAQQDNEEAMKYILEAGMGALQPGDPSSEFWPTKQSIPDPKSFFGFAGQPIATIYSSPRLVGLPLGKSAIEKFDYNAASNTLIPNGIQQIDNVFQGFVRGDNGKVYYHTTKSDIDGKSDPYKKFIPFEDASIDELVLGAPASQRPKLAAALRKGLKEMKAYKNLTPAFPKTESGKKKIAGF